MKNKIMIRRILIGLFLGIVVTSCTHNDGYIGPLFGKWQLIEMWENGTMTPHDSLYYNFQSSVIKLQLVHRGGIENTTENYFGSYVRENDILKWNPLGLNLNLIYLFSSWKWTKNILFTLRNLPLPK